ncbi:MAG TPA: class I SAM-dependent methyltransferase [Candidatus Acidoferrum sp.]|nr:class I SAM-dependent methyltransferase [Candidatus Acidoferrum sp.]
MTLGQERWLFEAAYSLASPANIVEIGSFKGRSTVALASGCRGRRKRVFSIDTFDGGGWDLDQRDFFAEFSENVKRCRVSQHVTVLRGKSTDVASGWSRPIHMLFIDGCHEYEAAKADFDCYFPHVVPGGIVAFHDVNEDWPGVLRLWNETVRDRLVDVGDCHSLAHGRKRKR